MRAFVTAGLLAGGFAVSACAQAPVLKPCDARQVMARFEQGTPEFRGKGNAGARLVLRNRSDVACTVPQKPLITFLDEHGAQLNATAATLPGMHPGPVLVPVTLAPGAQLASTLHWESRGVRDGDCIYAHRATIVLDRSTVNAEVEAHACAIEAGRAVKFQQDSFRPLQESEDAPGARPQPRR